MKSAIVFFLAVTACSFALAGDDFFDQIDQALTFKSSDARVRGRLSGTLDLEGYQFQDYAPGLVDTPSRELFNPRLTLFFDGQVGPSLYVFAQARIDRGFDPSDERLESRLDEYALRYTPWEDGRFQIQVGKFATVVGTWVDRHLSWDNPFIGAPLAYENLTGIWDTFPVPNSRVLLEWAHVVSALAGPDDPQDKYLRIPMIWGPSYANGMAISGRVGDFEYATEVKNASLASRPEAWSLNDAHWKYPTVSGRIVYRPTPMWSFGLSGSDGVYLRPEAASSLRPGRGLGDYRQRVFGQDASFAWHHWQVWAETLESRFSIPGVGNASVYSYYIETKYKITPQLFGAVRWNREWFGTIPLPDGPSTRWGKDISRIDLAGTYRLSFNTQVKLQFSLQQESGESGWKENAAVQMTVRF